MINRRVLLLFLLFIICLVTSNPVYATSDMSTMSIDSDMLETDSSNLALDESDAYLSESDLNVLGADSYLDNNLKDSSDSNSHLAFNDLCDLGEYDSPILKDDDKLSSKIISTNKKVYYSNKIILK